MHIKISKSKVIKFCPFPRLKYKFIILDPIFQDVLINRLNSLNIKQKSHYNSIIYVDPKPYDTKMQLGYDLFIDDDPNLIKSNEGSLKKDLFLYDQL